MTVTHRSSAVAVMALTLAVFVARPLLPGGSRGLLLLFAVLLMLGAGWPLHTAGRVDRQAAVPALAAGLAAFTMTRLLGGHPHLHQRPSYLAGIVLAAVAEELFFRRFVYAVLASGGAALAIGGSSALFAIAHVTVYGWWVLPLDLAAGLVLGWQRWASGTWTVPALTHVAANLLIVA